jgi:hypothetical protein
MQGVVSKADRIVSRVEGWRSTCRFGSSVSPCFLWECLNLQTMSLSPAPSSSHAACGFPALRAPAHFTSRVMGPIVPELLSSLAKPLYSVVVKQTEFLVQPLSTPPLPAEALALAGFHQVSPDLLFHPVSDK